METETQKPIQKRGTVADVVLNFLIFALCDVVWAVILGLVFDRLMPDSSLMSDEAFATVMVNVYAGVAFFLALFTATVFRPKKLRTIWIIGAVGPPAVLLIFLVFLLFKH